MAEPGSVDAVRQMAADRWMAITPEQALAMNETLSGLDPETILGDHVLLFAAGLSQHYALGRAGDRDHRTLVTGTTGLAAYCARAVDTLEDPDAVADYGHNLVVGLRVSGDLASAERAGAHVQDRLDELAGRGEAGPLGSRRWLRPGILPMQRGLTQTLLGEFGAAMRLYGDAWAARGEPPHRHFAGANAAANAAMLAVVEGHFELAGTWLERSSRLRDGDDGWWVYLTYLGEYIARAMLATAALDESAARTAVRDAGSGTEDVELWPFLAVAESGVELAFDDPRRAAEMLRATSFSHDPGLAWNTKYGGLLLRAYLDCLVAMGEGDRVLRLAKEAGRHTRTQLPVARVLLMAGENVSALQVADQAARRDDVHVRDFREFLLVRAVALLRLDRQEEAKEVFGSFLSFEDRYCAAMVARTPAQDYARLCELCGRTPPAAAPREHAAQPLKLVRLTRTEEQVLGLLVGGLTQARIAEATYTSVNTVKTHVRSIYRKLGVGSRAEAVTRARELGLVE